MPGLVSGLRRGFAKRAAQITVQYSDGAFLPLKSFIYELLSYSDFALRVPSVYEIVAGSLLIPIVSSDLVGFADPIEVHEWAAGSVFSETDSCSLPDALESQTSSGFEACCCLRLVKRKSGC